MTASRERGRPARTRPGTASAISATWINRERRHGSPSAWPMLFPQTGWLPAASHGSSAPAKGTSMRAGRPRSQAMPSRRCGGDHSRKNGRSLMKTNHEWTRMDTNRPEDRWTSFNDKRHQHASATCALGVTMSWDDGFLGARASRPHQAWHSLGHLLHRNQPAAAPCLCFGRAHAVPAGRAVGCNIAGKLSGNRRDSMRAGRPRSRGCRPDGEVGGIRRATSLKAGLSPLGNSRLPASRAPAPRDWADPSRRTIN